VIEVTQTLDVNDELDQKFQALDDNSKLTIALVSFSQCACAHRRFVGLGQMKHAHDYIFTDDAARTAQQIDPAIVGLIEEIRHNVKIVSEDPPDFMDADLAPKPVTRTREFLWSDAFEDPVWFDIRHAARRGLTTVEGVLAPRPGPPGPPPGGPSDA
jgi:hypothetical protein